MQPLPKRLKWSIYLSNLFLHYDSALFGLLAPFIAPLFFPHEQQIISLIFTYAMIPLAMIARPIGSLFFGYIGDHLGRKEALFLSLMGMALTTLLMGFLPSFAQVSFFAPFLLFLGRLFQNFFAAGESIGGAVFLVENSPEIKKNMTSSYFNASTVAGILVASSMVSIFCFLGWIDAHWRFLYWLGASAFIFACLLRVNISSYLKTSFSLQTSMISSLKSCFLFRKKVFIIAVASGFSYSTYSLALVLMNGFVPLISTQDHAQMVQINTFLLIADFLLLPFFGFLANCFSREKIMAWSAFLGFLTAIPLFWLLKDASYSVIIFIRLALIIMGVSFSAPFHAWAQHLIPTEERYTIVSFAYAIGTQLLGGPTVAISLWIYHQTGSVISASLYWMALAALTSVVLFSKPKNSKKALT